MREKRAKSIKTAVIILAVLLAIIATIALWRYVLVGDGDVTKETDTTQTTENKDDNDVVDEDTDATTNGETPTDGTSAPDPALFSSIVIDAAGIEVFYSKGIPGFQYRVLRTASGTEYIEFSADGLKGTKCTDDEGVFASIIENPSSSESQTVTVTTKVGNDTYGLSLASDTCTSDTALLQKYQAAFKNGFGSLRAVTEP